METFLTWLEERGLPTTHLLRVKYSEGSGWGVVCSRDIRYGEVVLRIPNTLIIRASAVANRLPYKTWLDRNPDVLTPFEALVLFFCFEDATNSEYGPYLDILPQKFYTVAAVCPTLPQACLPRSIRSMFIKQREELASIYAKLLLVTGGPLDYDRYIWAWHVVNTRCVYMENSPQCPLLDNSAGDTLAVVPYVDLFNHSTDAQTLPVYVKSSKTYELQTCRPLSEDNQMFVCYGAHSNARLLFEYGFTLPENPNNHIKLTVDKVVELCKLADIALSAEHLIVLQEAALGCVLYDCQLKPSWNVFATMRLISMTQDELVNYRKIIYNVAEFHDEALLLTLKSILQQYLEEMLSDRAEIAHVLLKLPDTLQSQIMGLWEEEISIINKCLAFQFDSTSSSCDETENADSID